MNRFVCDVWVSTQCSLDKMLCVCSQLPGAWELFVSPSLSDEAVSGEDEDEWAVMSLSLVLLSWSTSGLRLAAASRFCRSCLMRCFCCWLRGPLTRTRPFTCSPGSDSSWLPWPRRTCRSQNANAATSFRPLGRASALLPLTRACQSLPGDRRRKATAGRRRNRCLPVRRTGRRPGAGPFPAAARGVSLYEAPLVNTAWRAGWGRAVCQDSVRWLAPQTSVSWWMWSLVSEACPAPLLWPRPLWGIQGARWPSGHQSSLEGVARGGVSELAVDWR